MEEIKIRQPDFEHIAPTQEHCSDDSPDAVDGSILHVQTDHTNAAVVLHDQVQREVLNKVGGVEGQRAAVQGVKHRVAGAVSRRRAAVRLAT